MREVGGTEEGSEGRVGRVRNGCICILRSRRWSCRESKEVEGGNSCEGGRGLVGFLRKEAEVEEMMLA